MNKRFMSIAAMSMISAVALTACGGSDSNSDGSSEGGEETSKAMTIGVFNGWPEGEAVSELWQSILEEKGYDVELKYADAAPAFTALAGGDYDVVMDVWLPQTHEKYLDDNDIKDNVTELGAWNDEAVLTIAVNEDAPIDSLDELAANADKFDNRLIGIEAGAGLTEATNEQVIPGYGLEDMDYITSSTPAMLAELESKLEADENVAVTLWRPHWAYDEFAIKDLKDPKGTLGDAESIYSYGSSSFKEDFPEASEWISNFTMDSEKLFSLENAMFNDDKDKSDYDDVVEKWISENQDYVDGLTK
ncbi:glycine betaine ABC transporter substrate-binding protein [Arthrobacter roseus]|uniref:glycine betaine ABC transporter substrate-binding protein n=1 Tax=Arthrobacter roseus TaxID=136274 RepID=UPI001965CBA1|nr:glycine betaine ABC transporter substrate-binding protein [Arthrobacter roseus]MBM7847791.1 glycine betaine/proline transport system substrate-binding protein [Arthrobacter roseus]